MAYVLSTTTQVPMLLVVCFTAKFHQAVPMVFPIAVIHLLVAWLLPKCPTVFVA
jgi:hypothetical protein